MSSEDLSRNTRRRLRRGQACEYLANRHGIIRAPGTLAKYAVIGGGPRFAKLGRWPLYATEDLDLWAQEQIGPTVASTSELKMLGAA